jgi:hypothetical protein
VKLQPKTITFLFSPTAVLGAASSHQKLFFTATLTRFKSADAVSFFGGPTPSLDLTAEHTLGLDFALLAINTSDVADTEVTSLITVSFKSTH